MATTKKNVIKYINDNEAQVTKAFEKKACIFGTDEFKQWREYKEMSPKAKMVTKTIKKNPDQKTRRNMTYENMEAFISTLEEKEADKVMEEFYTIKKRSKIQKSPYQYVLSWFEAKFDGFNDLDQFMNQKEEERKQKEAEATANKPVATPAQNV